MRETIHQNISEQTEEARGAHRDRVDLLRNRVALLAGKDRLLMTMYLENSNSFRQMARLAGVNETSIARRIYRITRRLIDSEYITCLRNRSKFTNSEMVVAKDYFLSGMSIRKIAAKEHFTYYRVRKSLKKIQRLVEIIGRDRRG